MPDATQILWDWMACTSIINDVGTIGNSQLGMPTVVAPNSPYAASSTPIYQGLVVDIFGGGIPDTAFASLTLTIADTLTGDVVNGVAGADILNTGRGTIDADGNLTIALEAGDTAMTDVPGAAQVQRSMIIDWEYENLGPIPPASAGTGRHQVNFIVQALTGP